MTDAQVDTYVDVSRAELSVEDLRQELIYDARYSENGYDHRSNVRVLKAENDTLYDAVDRLLAQGSARSQLTLFDFGYGTGRVTNEFADSYHRYLATSIPSAARPGLQVIGYDISSVGLQRAQENLRQLGFEEVSEPVAWRRSPEHAYIAGRLVRERDGVTVQVTLIHGSESAAPAEVTQQIRRFVGYQQFDIVTSWYSALGHIQTSAGRQDFIAELAALTQPRGELMVAVATTGDLVEEQAQLKAFLEAGQRVSYPCESAQDLLYRTELGQVNFWHVFDVDLAAQMRQVTNPEQHFWIRAIRFPGDEFESTADELRNYERVARKNAEKSGLQWQPEDFAECHTVAARRSGLPEQWPNLG